MIGIQSDILKLSNKSLHKIKKNFDLAIKRAGSLDNLIDFWIAKEEFNALVILPNIYELSNKQKEKIEPYLLCVQLLN
jgi:hypothetical protein